MGINGDCFHTSIERLKKGRKLLEGLQSRKAGWCDFCDVKMTVITTSLRGKHQKIGSFCPVCWDINSWVK